ncbi:hypothetical protein H6F61_03505 [Cyanobacteria bacterium FACHB-472]|nr:hypothetical protein [Cyanobacteria bacterium FACHB-472]
MRLLTSFDAGAGDRSFMTNTPYRCFQISSENFKVAMLILNFIRITT